MYWMYNGKRVIVPPGAEIHYPYQLGQPKSGIVQLVLDETEPWEVRDDPIQTIVFDDERFPAMVVPTEGRPVSWAFHHGHKAKSVQQSPFVASRGTTDAFTIELTQSSSRPMLVRAYPGEYVPPLPWQRTATNAPGGLRECTEFWNTHAYVYDDTVMGVRTRRAPEWFKQ